MTTARGTAVVRPTADPAADAAGGGFVCLLGLDDARTRRVLGALARTRPDVLIVDWERVRSGLAAYLEPMASLAPVGPFVGAGRLCLVAALEYDLLIAPAIAAGRPVVIEGYWYRFIADALLRDHPAPSLEPACHSLPAPARVVLLDGTVEGTASRTPLFDEVPEPVDPTVGRRALRGELLRLVGTVPVEVVDRDVGLDAVAGRLGRLCVEALPAPAADGRR